MAASVLDPRIEGTYIGDVDASATPVVNCFVAPCACVIGGVSLVCGDTLALHATDYGDYNVTNVTDSEEVASLSTKTGEDDANAIAPDTEEEMTLATTASYLELDAGDVLQFHASEGGTATSGDLTEAYVIVKWAPGTGVGQS